MTLDVSRDVSLNLGRIGARIARHLEVALAEVDLSLPQYRILIFLDEGGAAASALAERLAVTRPSVTAVVDGLVAKGLVERRADPHDRRKVDHVMTKEGFRVLKAADKATQSHLECIAAQGAATPPAELVTGMESWREALDGHFATVVSRVSAAESAK